MTFPQRSDPVLRFQYKLRMTHEPVFLEHVSTASDLWGGSCSFAPSRREYSAIWQIPYHPWAQMRAFGDSDIPQVPPLSAAGEPHVILPHEEAPRGAAAVLACEEVRASTPGAPCARRCTRALRQGSIPWSRRGTSRQEPSQR